MKLRRHSREHTRHPVRRFLIAVSLFAGLVFVVMFGSSFYLAPQDTPVSADAIIVVSGGQTQTRAKRGIELYKQGLAPTIVFSGAALDDGPSNAREMASLARRSGVPERAIIIDEAAQTTYQNATNTKGLLATQPERVLLVTSPYHQRRTLLTFRKIYGESTEFVNTPSFDNEWSRRTWWASPFGVFITGSELAKIGYIYATGNFE